MDTGDRLFRRSGCGHHRLVAWGVIACLTAAAGAGCRSWIWQESASQPDPEKLARRYRDTHDYQSLVALLPLLEIRKARRADVEKLLGPPAYCPTPFQSYYPTDRSVPVELEADSQPAPDGTAQRRPMEFQVILVVQYLEAGPEAAPSDSVDAFSLGPVGE